MTYAIASRFVVAALALIGLSACSPQPAAQMAAATPGEAGCLRDVAETTNNPEVTILESVASEAGTEITLGVGPDKAPWRCIGYADGATAGIMSLTNEGAL